MARAWYVLHSYTGFENRVEKAIRSLMEEPEFSERILDVKVPEEECEEEKNGKRRKVKRKFLPGYVLVEMDLPDTGWRAVIAAIRRINGVTGFVGSGGQSKPHPISQDEAKQILQKSGELKGDRALRFGETFSPRDNVRVKDGPFVGFEGVVEEVNEERKKVRVLVGIFGRSTPVDLDFSQVEKI
ncbi:transcription termination/antitermination protein NusG [Spirochaetia bacterium 38H-sp]|uniref:Transcription termination/antitermination protein NusG n=1 Tax=Rarispira pelagica TaxID=3141764 RepID=A0ABU9UDJ5_9SPIR